MARHTRSLPSRHGTLTQRISSARGGPSDAIGLPPVCTLVIRHDRCVSLAERGPLCTGTAGVGWGPRWPQRGRTTSKVRRVWVVNGTACSWRAIILDLETEQSADGQPIALPRPLVKDATP